MAIPGNGFSAKLGCDLYELVSVWLGCEIKYFESQDVQVTFILNFLLIAVVSTFKSGTVIRIFHRKYNYGFFSPVVVGAFFFFSLFMS